MDKEKSDHVDMILAQWRRERPELDVEPMGIFGRLKRLTTHIGREVDAVLLKHGLSSSSFDVLATLRRSGAPYRLSPGELLGMTMVSSGTMTSKFVLRFVAPMESFVVSELAPKSASSVIVPLSA